MITVIDLSARNPYPAFYSSMAGGKETHKLLPLALVHTQISRDVHWSRKKGYREEENPKKQFMRRGLMYPRVVTIAFIFAHCILFQCILFLNV